MGSISKTLSDNTKARPDDPYIVPAVEQASRVLFCLARAESSRMSLIEICAAVGIHKSKAFSILHTLQQFGLVTKSSEGRGYSLGPGTIGLSRRFLDNLSLPKMAEPILEDLAKQCGATAALGLIAEDNVFVAAKNEGGRQLGVAMRVGQRFPLTYGAHGKAIAAFLPEAELATLLKGKQLYFQGDPKRFSKVKLMKDLERCRRDWFAEDREETALGLNGVASPVLGPGGTPIGYVVVLGFSSGEAAHHSGPLVAQAGKTLSRQLGARVEAESNGRQEP